MFLHVENKEDQVSYPERDCVHDNLNPDCDLSARRVAELLKSLSFKMSSFAYRRGSDKTILDSNHIVYTKALSLQKSAVHCMVFL